MSKPLNLPLPPPPSSFLLENKTIFYVKFICTSHFEDVCEKIIKRFKKFVAKYPIE
jgi:hypothetical protein